MLKYFNQSPLWKYLISTPNLPLVTIESSIAINTNLVKGYLAGKLYNQDYTFQYFKNLLTKTKLEQYDRLRIEATFKEIPSKLTGLERPEYALPFKYTYSIFNKTQEYYNCFKNLVKRNKIDILDLYILINPKSTSKCFNVLVQNIEHIPIPHFFLSYLQNILYQKQQILSQQNLKKIIEYFNECAYSSEKINKLNNLLIIKTFKFNKAPTQRIFGEQYINQVLEILKTHDKQMVITRVLNPEDISIIQKNLSHIGQGIDLNNASFSLKLKVLDMIRKCSSFLPKRNPIRQTTPEQEKNLKMKLFEDEKKVLDHIALEMQNKLKFKQTEEKEVIELISLSQEYLIGSRSLSNIISSMKQELINKLISNPILYLNNPVVFIKICQMGINNKNYNQLIIKQLSKHLSQILKNPCPQIHKYSLQLLSNSKFPTTLSSILLESISNSPISLKQYLSNLPIYSKLPTLKIQPIQNITQLFTQLLKTQQLPSYKHLSPIDESNLKVLYQTLKTKTPKTIKTSQNNSLIITADQKQLVFNKSSLFEIVFEVLKPKQRKNKRNQK